CAYDSGCLTVTAAEPYFRRYLIIGPPPRHKLPAVYPSRSFAKDGGLITYGADPLDAIRRAAGYVDRILKGEKPTDLPVQAPTKYELVINLKTAKALGLNVPDTLLARADAAIEGPAACGELALPCRRPAGRPPSRCIL